MQMTMHPSICTTILPQIATATALAKYTDRVTVNSDEAWAAATPGWRSSFRLSPDTCTYLSDGTMWSASRYRMPPPEHFQAISIQCA